MKEGPSIAVIGGGVSGLTSALRLLEEFPKLEVTVLSDLNYQQTTSWGPAGIFRPGFLGDIAPNRARKWIKYSFDRFSEIFASSQCVESGVQMISGYVQSPDLKFLKNEQIAYGDILLNFRFLEESELKMFHNPRPYGTFMTTFTSEGRKFVPWLTKQLLQKGCKFKKRHIDSFSELSGKFDYVINCAGLRATSLTGDPLLRPMKGLLLELDAPWIKHFLYHDNYTYIIPTTDRVFVGGTKQMDTFDLSVSKADRDDLWRRALDLLPNLKDAAVLGEWTGLRPYRNGTPRVELQIFNINQRPMKVVHNYGHGSIGFTLSWGCQTMYRRLFTKI